MDFFWEFKKKRLNKSAKHIPDVIYLICDASVIGCSITTVNIHTQIGGLGRVGVQSTIRTLFCHGHTEQDSNTLLCLMCYYLCLYIRQNEWCNLIFNLLATIQTDIHVFTSAKYDSLHFSRKLIVIHRNWQDWNLYDLLLTSVILLLLFFRLFKS